MPVTVEIVDSPLMIKDGHCTYLPANEWIANDTYRQGKERLQEVFLFHVATKKKVSPVREDQVEPRQTTASALYRTRRARGRSSRRHSPGQSSGSRVSAGALPPRVQEPLPRRRSPAMPRQTKPGGEDAGARTRVREKPGCFAGDTNPCLALLMNGRGRSSSGSLTDSATSRPPYLRTTAAIRGPGCSRCLPERRRR